MYTTYIFKITFLLVILCQNSLTMRSSGYDELLVEEINKLKQISTKVRGLTPLNANSVLLAGKKASELKISGPNSPNNPKTDDMSTLYCTIYLDLPGGPRIGQITIHDNPVKVPPKYTLRNVNFLKSMSISLENENITEAACVLQEIIADANVSKEIEKFNIAEAGLFFDNCEAKQDGKRLGVVVEVLLALRLQPITTAV